MAYKPFNVIISHLPGLDARQRVATFMRQTVGYFYIAGYVSNNLVLGKVRDPLAAAEALLSRLSPQSPILRFIPVLEITGTRLSEVRPVVLELLSRRPGSFAIRLDGHLEDEEGRPMSRRDAIVALAEGVERKVDLERPEVLVYVKVVKFRGRWVSAIYVGDPKYVISVAKLPP
ncbi:MAG: THUMP domain-containing protein [Acidilobaceae archaeon]|nr:THUMP domain-containing protein [Acidilobaceae archaeon]